MSNPSDIQSSSGQQKRRSNQSSFVLESTTPVRIADLTPRNNNSTFIGKIISLEVVEKGLSKDGSRTRRFFKGIIGDETGTIRFDLAEKNGSSFIVGDIVSFDKAMNKVSKEGHHYVEVKRLGSYTVLQGQQIAVNSAVNKSEQVVIPQLEGDNTRPPRAPRVAKPRTKPEATNNVNEISNNNGSNSSNGRNVRTRSNRDGAQSNASLNQSSRNAGRIPQHGAVSAVNGGALQRPQTYIRPSNISTLEPGVNGQIVVGKVVEVSNYTRVEGEEGRNSIYQKGKVADETGSISFDFKLRVVKGLAQNDIVQFSNIMNKVDELGFHYFTIGRFGFFNIYSDINVNLSDHCNKSTIEYVKQQSNF